MPLSTNLRPGSCEIIGMLRAGGVAELCRARGAKQRRDVAITVLPGALR